MFVPLASYLQEREHNFIILLPFYFSLLAGGRSLALFHNNNNVWMGFSITLLMIVLMILCDDDRPHDRSPQLPLRVTADMLSMSNRVNDAPGEGRY